MHNDIKNIKKDTKFQPPLPNNWNKQASNLNINVRGNLKNALLLNDKDNQRQNCSKINMQQKVLYQDKP